MNTTSLHSTKSGQLPKSKRISVPIRLTIKDHLELKSVAINQQRSMSFVAMRRYLIGLSQELSSTNNNSENISLIEGVKNVK